MTDPILIVGAGPVGLTMALELTRYKVPVRLIDKMAARSGQSRAIAIWPRTLELLERAGVGADLVAHGNKVGAADIMTGRKLIARIDITGVASPYPFGLMIPQCDTEAVLEQHLEHLGSHTELGVEMTAFTQDENGVMATLRLADGRSETQRFSCLIACDGAHSPVRHALGLAFEGDTIGMDWCFGDFLLSGVPSVPDEVVTYWHENGPIIFFPLAPGRYRVIASLGSSGEAVPATPTLEAFQAIVDRRGPGGITLEETKWSSVFRINERQVAQYRVGRVFLAGDAAHIHSPAGGQGMNTGMQDAINLAWKLAMVSRGLASSPVLLDSYDAERRPVGAAVIATTGRLTKLGMLTNPVAQDIRNVLAHVVLGLAPVQHAIAGATTEVSIGYPASPLNGPDGSGVKAGTRMPPLAGEIPYGSGHEPRFTLRSDAPPDTGLVERFAAILDPAVRPAPDGGGIALVRPDGYLACAAHDGNWEAIEASLSRLTSQ
jgi:2-polyprenyl-6-methoxyphenol hydroxylase-like FAD-dependent oxidoreductase